jgi:penicillin-binding protein 1A
MVYLYATLPALRLGPAADLKLASVAYTADGQELAYYYEEFRTWVPFSQIARPAIQALVATEDQRFFQHIGIDPVRLLSSVFYTAQGDRQGGSTITMQLARNLYPEIGKDITLYRKLREMLMALKLEFHYSKQQVLEMYLNTVTFGNNAFGIEAAARTYFNKSAAALGVAESALLVGMLKATTRYNPVRHPDLAQERRNVVMAEMVDAGLLARATFDSLRSIPVVLDFRAANISASRAPYFAEYVRTWANDWARAHGYNLYTDGLRLYTTLDTRLQALAEQAVTEQMEGLQAVVDYEWGRADAAVIAGTPGPYQRLLASGQVSPFAYFWETHPELVAEYTRQSARYREAVAAGLNAEDVMERLLADAVFMDSLRAARTRLEGGLVSIDPANGHVLVWVGGRDFDRDRYDKVALSRRQPGSTFKPFVYATAIDLGYTPSQTVTDVARTYRTATGERWTPQNAGDRFTGRSLTLRQALARSKNSVSAYLIDKVGPEEVVRLAKRMGIRSELAAVPSLALGTSEVTLLELTSAYATFAAMGLYHEPVMVTRIEDRNGRLLASFNPPPQPALSQHTAYTLIDLMRDAVEPGGTGVGIRYRFGVEGDLAGKTGTTQNSTDGWFMLAHPRLVTGAWVGFNDARITFRSDTWGQGGHNALRLVGAFLGKALEDQGDAWRNARFEPPAGYEKPKPKEPVRVARTADTDTTTAPALEPDEGEALDALMLDDVVITPPEDPLPLPDPLPTAPPDTTDQ